MKDENKFELYFREDIDGNVYMKRFFIKSDKDYKIANPAPIEANY